MLLTDKKNKAIKGVFLHKVPVNLFLELKESDNRTLSSICKTVDSSQANSWNLFRKFQEAGLIKIVNNPFNKRSKRVILTVKGKEIRSYMSELDRTLR